MHCREWPPLSSLCTLCFPEISFASFSGWYARCSSTDLSWWVIVADRSLWICDPSSWQFERRSDVSLGDVLRCSPTYGRSFISLPRYLTYINLTWFKIQSLLALTFSPLSDSFVAKSNGCSEILLQNNLVHCALVGAYYGTLSSHFCFFGLLNIFRFSPVQRKCSPRVTEPSGTLQSVAKCHRCLDNFQSVTFSTLLPTLCISGYLILEANYDSGFNLLGTTTTRRFIYVICHFWSWGCVFFFSKGHSSVISGHNLTRFSDEASRTRNVRSNYCNLKFRKILRVFVLFCEKVFLHADFTDIFFGFVRITNSHHGHQTLQNKCFKLILSQFRSLPIDNFIIIFNCLYNYFTFCCFYNSLLTYLILKSCIIFLFWYEMKKIQS